MGAQRTWTNLLFLILRQITRMGTDKIDPPKPKPKSQVSLLSVLVVKSVVKYLQNPILKTRLSIILQEFLTTESTKGTKIKISEIL